MRKSLAILGAVLAIAVPASAAASSEHHRHHFSTFLGGSAGHHDGFSGGVEYHYRINRWFSLGPSIEVTDAHGTPTLLIGALNLHPWPELKLIFGPGVEPGISTSVGTRRYSAINSPSAPTMRRPRRT